ncbi:Fic family protein [Bifidobacterium cebidarum]|uniref:Cell division protein Fic n=1 Tax=Bifidobacterium cebidarum TaxID=2650773 RepID=A0A6I1GDQ4_9BIFI|nr:Fic family protein [Bifidobacterium cebidarum]KAB7788812.1 cell division protein Fic [Bifidobacterium cebidarum]
MKQFDYIHTAEALLTPRTTSLLTAIHEAKGRQSVQAVIRPDILESMTAIARIQSTSASNRIEGISTSDKRLNALVEEKTTPRNRDEEEIAGYRDVLATIHESHDYIPLTPNVILQLHRDMFRHTPLTFGGHFKDSDNVIVERDSQGNNSVRFAPPSALITPEYIEQACAAYNNAIRDGRTDPLLAIAMFVFDFTCIHPFNDGNGRMSRLLTLLLLYRAGYNVGKYISIEHLIERSKATYYEALAASTKGWNENTNDYGPFVNYLLGIILRACKVFDERVAAIIESSSALPTHGKITKEQRVVALFSQTLSPLSKAEILTQLPDISETTVERVLRSLLNSGTIVKLGAGRSTRYIKQRQA